VHAEVAVGGAQQDLQVVERQLFLHRERAHDRQAQALVNQLVEVQRRRRVGM